MAAEDVDTRVARLQERLLAPTADDYLARVERNLAEGEEFARSRARHSLHLAMLARERPDALLVINDPLFTSRNTQIVLLAARHTMPAIFTQREYAEIGGLMSYGTSPADAYRQLGAYAGQVLKGIKPAELPVVQASKFEFVINLQAAKVLDLEIPPTLLARADEVIE